MSWDYTVSLLMPVYNGEKHVADAIDSVLAQTLESVELVIINDGSSDGSEAVIAQYLPHDDITYISQENQGFTETVNRAIKLAAGEYLGIHPQDDLSVPYRLEKQVDILDRMPEVGFVYSPARFVDLQGNEMMIWGDCHGEGRVPNKEMFHQLYVNGMSIASPSVIFRRDHITDDDQPWGDPELAVASDWEHWMIAAQRYDAYEMGEPLIKMLRDPDHSHLAGRMETVLEEEKTVLRRLRARFADGDPPVTSNVFSRAMSNYYLRELRYRFYEQRAYRKGIRATMESFRYNPRNADLYREYAAILDHLVSSRESRSLVRGRR